MNRTAPQNDGALAKHQGSDERERGSLCASGGRQFFVTMPRRSCAMLSTGGTNRRRPYRSSEDLEKAPPPVRTAVGCSMSIEENTMLVFDDSG
jgi:hypothetical protein